MKLAKLKEYIFENLTEEQAKFTACAFMSLILSGFILYFQKDTSPHADVPEKLKPNLQVLIPKNHVLYPFEASNFESIEPILDAFNMVQIYEPRSGVLLAKNVKVLRAPKDPSHLSFLVPVNIANRLAPYGMEFKIALQKYKNTKAIWTLKQNRSSRQQSKITFGG